MTRSGLAVMAGMAVALASASVLAQTGVVTLSNPAPAWRVSGFSGGAFVATPVSGYIGEVGGPGPSPGTSFLTFCMERNESVSITGTYNTEIAMSAVGGGIAGGVNGADPLDSRTAAMYWHFRQGGDFGGPVGVIGVLDTAATADLETQALQLAIWLIEQELTQAQFDAQGNALAAHLVAWANGGANYPVGYGSLVRVLRLTSINDGSVRQDQLTIVPLPPAAWAGIGSLAGVAAIGYVRRRKQLS